MSAELGAIEQASITELIGAGATPEQAAAELDDSKNWVKAFARAPLIGAPTEDS